MSKLMDQLKELKELLDMELITEDEFTAKKRHLLGLESSEIDVKEELSNTNNNDEDLVLESNERDCNIDEKTIEMNEKVNKSVCNLGNDMFKIPSDVLNELISSGVDLFTFLFEYTFDNGDSFCDYVTVSFNFECENGFVNYRDSVLTLYVDVKSDDDKINFNFDEVFDCLNGSDERYQEVSGDSRFADDFRRDDFNGLRMNTRQFIRYILISDENLSPISDMPVDDSLSILEHLFEYGSSMATEDLIFKKRNEYI